MQNQYPDEEYTYIFIMGAAFGAAAMAVGIGLILLAF